MKSLLLSLLCAFGLPACMAQAAQPETSPTAATAADEMAERTAIFDTVKAAIAANDFSGLSAMEEDFRSTRARTSSGTWKLAFFHTALQAYLANGLESGAGCDYRRADFVHNWAIASPHNPAPFITDAALLLKQAWCFRGSGYASSVAEDAWPKFRKYVADASKALDSHRKTALIDPEFDTVNVDILRSAGTGPADFRRALDDAAAREPDYHRTYFNAVWYYLPQWGGSYEAVEAFARFAAERTRAEEGAGLYIRIFWSFEECGCHILDRAAEWPMLKQSMRDLYDRYPSPWNGAYFADLACRKGDTQEGRHYYRAMHPGTSDADLVAMFTACDNRALFAEGHGFAS